MAEQSDTEVSNTPLGAVAIIGMAGRFPGANNIAEFWRNIRDGVESVSRFADAELEDSFDAEVRGAPNFVKARPILENVEDFDAPFFGMHPRDAELTDPQHRIFLECCWEALEDAGYDPATYPGSIAVIAGASPNTYFLHHVCADRRTVEEFTSNFQVGCYPMLLGAAQDFLSTRVSYKLDLKGPSLTLQTACSTSLLAVSKACQSLLLYESDMALAGGVSITFPQKRGYQHLEGGMVSADGSCRPFDADASGTVFGSGAGAVLLKRLEDALKDGDHIYAVVRGSGVNNDGGAKVGFTAPSSDGQAAVIEMALANADVDSRSISYVECHGTATPMGDPIEIAGLTKAYGGGTADHQFCAIGSVKGNVGHLDAAAGVAGLIKTALCLEEAVLAPSLNFRRPNPQIDFAQTPFFVNSTLRPWPQMPQPRRAGVSAFGVGGTNVHVILEQAPPLAAAPPQEARPELIILSARSPVSLARARGRLAAHLRAHPAARLADVAHTLQVGRRAFDHRTSLVARTVEEAAGQLGAADPLGGEGQKGISTARTPKRADVVFMFPGQGAQYPGMGRDLYEHEAVFRHELQRCAEILNPLMSDELLDLLYGGRDPAGAAQRLMSTVAAQPAIFSVEYALARLWMSVGIKPRAMIGHSVGEFVAAVIAEVMSLEDALSVVATRGRLMQALPGGAMLAVRLAEAEVTALLTPTLALAAVNGPTLCVVAGPFESIAEFERMLGLREVVSRRLHTSHAFHSAMVDPVIAPLRGQLQSIRLSAPKIPYVSGVSGDWVRDEQAASPDYWARHAREPVRFADGIARMRSLEAPILVEVGPGNALSTLATQATRGSQVSVVTSMQGSSRERDDRELFLGALGRSWTLGAAPDWSAIRSAGASRVSLPTYPFERSRHWIELPKASASDIRSTPTEAAANESPPSPIQDPSAMNHSPPDSSADLSAAIASIFEELSGDRPPAGDTQTTFLEMGYDSLFLTQVAQKILSQMKVKISFRQLLGDYSTIPSLAAFLAETMPAHVPALAPSPAAAAAVAVARAAPVAIAPPPAVLNASAAAGAIPGMEALFREQLQAMSQLINRQFEVLQQNSGSRSLSDLPAPPLASVVASVPASQQPSRFEVFVPRQKTADSQITPEQEQHIAALVERYTKKTAGSKRFTQEHRTVLADPRAAAGFRSEWKEMVYPIVNTTSAGSKLYDIDGNEYIDLVNGYGQTAFGHAPPFVIEAVRAQLERGFAIGPQADAAGKVAALFCKLTGNERMTFCNTGSEAVMAAMRLARTVTGREKIVVFNGDYHGQFDEVLVKGVQRPGAAPRSVPVAPGIPGSQVENMVVLEYGTQETLQWIRENAKDLAAVVVEPVQSRHPHLRPFDFLREIRKITQESGSAFVMDEVVTGFRVHPGGIQAVAGIRADLATYGKIIGGGLPIGVLAGTAKFMDALDGGNWRFGDDSFPEVGVTFFAGTFVRHPLVLAAMWAVLNHLQEQGPALQENLSNKTAKLVARLNELFASRRVATKIESYSSWFYFHFHNEHPLATLLFYHLRERGIHIQDGFPCFLTTAHTDADFERIYTAFEQSLDALQSVGILGESSAARAAPAIPAVAKASSPQSVPLTESQLEIWLSAQLGDEASCAFNESVSLRMTGEVDAPSLQSALNQLVARHDALRATFSPTGEEMRIAPAASFMFPFTNLSDRPHAGAAAALAALVDTDARTPFDLVAGPCIRGHLVKLAPRAYTFIITAHHIVCDGWSINILVTELAQIYEALRRGEQAALPAAMPFSEYARAQTRRDQADLEQTEQFWVEEFADRPGSLELPTDRPRPTVKSFSGASLCRRIDATLYQAVKKAGARQRSTLFVTLLAACQALMGRLADQTAVVIGVPTAGQSLLDDQILVGHCVNFLPIRGTWNRDTTVAEFLSATARRVLDAYEHQNYTFGTLVRTLNLPRQPGRLPLTEIQFNLERLADRIELPGLTIEVDPNPKAFVNFDLFLNVIESTDGLRLDCDYNTDLFDAATIAHWLDCFQALLESIVADAAQPISRASCLPLAERALLLDEFNHTASVYPRERTIHQLISAQSTATPDAIAVQFGGRSLSYEALDRRANRLANLLRARIGGAENRLIGVSVERSVDMLVALLAVLKAGCAYVPLDPMHPASRLRYILDEAQVAALISDGSETASLAPHDVPVIDVIRDESSIAAASSAAPVVAARAADLAYVIYTSGSTGKPKGVEVTHTSVVNLLTSMARRPGLTAQDAFYAVTTISFDIAALELFLPLSVGARLIIAERDTLSDGFRLLKNLQTGGVTAMQGTPASWRLLLEAGFRSPARFKMLCGGEALPRELANRLLEGEGELWNMYGPTETTIWSSCVRVTPGTGPISVGGPIANTQFYVLDHNDQPVPMGIPGQLHIGGAGVARGYYKRAALTDEKFVPNPFAAGRMYRSGDLARWLPGGSLQVLGRIDHQVKLRGFRIELGEIESVLLAKGDLSDAAVILREDARGTPRLVAYYVEKPGSSHKPDGLRGLLAEEMPDYMIPSAWVRLDALPLSPNGKLDRGALPAPESNQIAELEFIGPTTATEVTLTRIIGEVLNLERVGVTADLLKLGADSIQLFQITARANRADVKVTAKQLLQHRNARALAAVADAGPEIAAPSEGKPLPSLSQFKRNRRAG